MWLVMAIATAMCWGLSYTAAGQVLKQVDKSIYLAISSVVHVIFWVGLAYSQQHDWRGLQESRQSVWIWISLAIGASLAGTYMSFAAVELKNPTYAAVAEVTYPVFCALFTLLLLGHNPLTFQSVIGMLMVMGGVVIFVLGEK